MNSVSIESLGGPLEGPRRVPDRPWRTPGGPEIGSRRGPRGSKMPKIAKIRDLAGFGGRTLEDPSGPEIRVLEGRKWSENRKIRKKKCEIFPKFVENRQKTAFFRPFYGAPRPRKWENYLRTPRSLGGHLYAPAPKQWSIGAPRDFP